MKQQQYKKDLNRLRNKKNLKEYLKNPDNLQKHYARCAVYRAVRDGKLVRPNLCSLCGLQCKPEADHKDYTKRLEVEWYCKTCHGEITNARNMKRMAEFDKTVALMFEQYGDALKDLANR